MWLRDAAGGQGGRRAVHAALLVAFAVSGAAALSYEVIWTRALSVVLGSTTHAVASMLATFMLGLAIGGIVGGRVAGRVGSAVAALGLCEVGIGGFGVASLWVVRGLPEAYLWVYRTWHLAPGPFYGVQIALCAAVMLVPTVLMGMTFPLVTRALVTRLEEVGSTVGAAYSANTAGAVAGALLSGFALVPGLGLTWAAIATASANVSIGMALLVLGGRPRALVVSGIFAAVAAAVAASESGGWSLVSFYTASRHLDGTRYDDINRESASHYERLYARDGADARVAAFRGRAGDFVLQVGGKLEGTTVIDRVNAALLAYLPVAAHAEPRTMLVVGLGAGVTLGIAKRIVPEVELVEISESVLEAVGSHGPTGLLDGIRIHHDDARTHLLIASDTYDVISSEPSYPTDHAVGNLFTVEYYRVASARLAEGGIYCQWLPRYMMTDDDVEMMSKTFASVFPFATAWRVPDSDDLLLLGSMTPLVRSPGAVVARVTALNGGAPLPFTWWRGSAAIAALARRGDIPLNTDDHPLLEFRVARNLRVGDVPRPEW